MNSKDYCGWSSLCVWALSFCRRGNNFASIDHDLLCTIRVAIRSNAFVDFIGHSLTIGLGSFLEFTTVHLHLTPV